MTEPDCVGNKFWFEEGFEKIKKLKIKKLKPKLALFSTSTGTNNSDGIGLCTFNLEMQ